MTSDTTKKITDLYQDILKRSPDKTGLYYFVSKINKRELTFEDVKKILNESDEAKSLKEYTHYSDKYWNDLEVVGKYKNKLATGNENVHWIGDILNRFKEYLPFDDVLVVGCGNGWLERQLYDLGIGKHFDAFDMSEKYVNEAKELKQSRAIDYFLDDINSMSKIENNKYDVALDHLFKAIKVQPNNVDAVFAICNTYTKKRYYTDAITYCETALKLNPKDSDFMNRLAWLYAKKGINIDLGIKLIQKTLKVYPNRSDYIDTLSELYYAQGDIVEAVKEIRKAINLKPDHAYYKQQLWKFKNVAPKSMMTQTGKAES